MGWRQERRSLPPPTAEEIADWADGVVYHQTEDGATLRYVPERGWEPCP